MSYFLQDILNRGSDKTPNGHFRSLKYAFYVPNVILIISVLSFFLSSIYVTKDKKKYEEEIGIIKDSKI